MIVDESVRNTGASIFRFMICICNFLPTRAMLTFLAIENIDSQPLRLFLTFVIKVIY